MPQTYGQQPPMYQQPYAQQSTPMDFSAIMRKTFLIIAIGIGALFLFIARLMVGFVTDYRIINVISTLGGFMIAVPAVVWALGSKRTTDNQNLGLLILAGLIFLAMIV